MKNTNEVNISTPNEAQRLSMNPYAFITMYKSGYRLSMKTTTDSYIIHLQAIHPARSMQEFLCYCFEGLLSATDKDAARQEVGND